jgi:hypothetical protein
MHGMAAVTPLRIDITAPDRDLVQWRQEIES